MNTEVIALLQKQVEDNSATIDNLKKTVNSLKINDQRRLNSNNPIPPGIACKVSYDANGLVTKGIGLETTDIPDLNIDKIINLKKYLDSKASTKDLELFKKSVTDMIQPTVKNLGEIAGTGIKFNYNSDGRIISSAELLAEDIPMIPISKIQGLSDIINSLTFEESLDSNESTISNIKVSSGVFTKVNVDNYGRVVSGDKLTIDDIPIELINKINYIESKIPYLASQHTVDAINNNLSDKLNSNKPITPGTYTKIKVDSKGLVISGEKLNIRDLPELSISDISDLEKILISKATQNDLINLSDTVSSIVNSLNDVGDIIGMKNELKNKASDEEVKKISSRITSIQNTVDSLVNRMPGDMIEKQLQVISNELSNLSGRISVIEQTLSLE